MKVSKKKYGFIKPFYDAHTLGLQSVIDALESCDQQVFLADQKLSEAVYQYRYEAKTNLIIDWIVENSLDFVGLTYRLDSNDAVEMMGYLIQAFKNNNVFFYQGGSIEKLYFAGLVEACEAIKKQHGDLVDTFMGGESIWETLKIMNVDSQSIPLDWSNQHKYDEDLQSFAKQLIKLGDYNRDSYRKNFNYDGYGSKEDTLEKRISDNQKRNTLPLIRVHVGPYYSNLSTQENVEVFKDWIVTLSQSKLLDVLSIGSSQLSQSHFNQPWDDLPNGGGVPIQKNEQLIEIYESSRPMLLRTYAGTTNIVELAKIYEETINISWHALSLWWFNKLDDRGPNDLYANLKEHVETIKYIASSKKPFEANVSHHFAFRGSDDVSYIVSAYLCAKLAKKYGVKTFVLQNMLNTPRLTWGIADLAKSQAMVELIRTLEDETFSVVVQPRAGLDYFKPDLTIAKEQLAAVSAMMDDIEPNNPFSPNIVHVVSYSEAISLATPPVILESIEITLHAIAMYRKAKKEGSLPDVGNGNEVKTRKQQLIHDAKHVIQSIEEHVDDPYSAQGFYVIFAAGFLPVPYLWREKEQFKHAIDWKVKAHLGSMTVFDHNNHPMDVEKRMVIAVHNIKQAKKNVALMQLSEL